MADPRRSLLPKNRGERKTLYSDAERYDLVYGPYGTGEFVAFYRRQVSRYGEPVLELGCGTGRLLIPLAEDGTNMIGVNIAPAMLDVARKKASSRSLEISVATADMRNFDLGKKFKLILLPANAMMHLVAREEVDGCLASVLRHLVDGGRFVLEVYNPALTLLSAPPAPVPRSATTSIPKRACGSWLRRQISYDAATQVNHVTYHYLHGVGATETTLHFEIRQFFPQELDALLTHAGFVIEEKYGDRDESKFTSASMRQIVVCRTPSGSIRPRKRESKRPK